MLLLGQSHPELELLSELERRSKHPEEAEMFTPRLPLLVREKVLPTVAENKLPSAVGGGGDCGECKESMLEASPLPMRKLLSQNHRTLLCSC